MLFFISGENDYNFNMKRKGQALIIVVIVFGLIVSVFAISISTAMRSHALEETEIYQREQALYLAQMGINQMIYNINNGTTYTNGQSINGTSPDIGTYKATYITPDNSGYGGIATIKGEGTVGQFTRRIFVSLDSPLRDPMMVYAKANGDPTPYYRVWSGSDWGSPLEATPVSGSIQYLVLKFARTRREAILGILDSTGNITIQIFNGTSWSSVMSVGTTANDDYRGFDIEYESSSDRAIIVYNNISTPQYSIWNGVSLSSALSITVPTTGIPRWIEMAPNPHSTSNEIVMAYIDSNGWIYGMRWTGSAWDNMGEANTWDTSIASSTTQCFDVAYESSTGRAMFIWGDETTDYNNYRIWDGVSLTTLSQLHISKQDGVSEWVRLVSDPNSNNLLFGAQDAQRDLNTAEWNGTSWTVHSEHDSSTENRRSRNFDLVYETYPLNTGFAWLVWGDGKFLSRKRWNGSSWSDATAVGDDTAFVKLIADPITGNVLSAIYGDPQAGKINEAIFASQLTGGGSTWSIYQTIWGGRIVAQPVMERVTIATGKSTTTRVKPSTYREEY